MTRAQHYEIYIEHSAKANSHLQEAINSAEANDYTKRDYEFAMYKQERKIAQKHYGIQRAMQTRAINKMCGYKAV